MTDPTAVNDPRLADRDFLYKEYVRLSERTDALMKQSFSDFRLLGVIGASAGLVVKLAPMLSVERLAPAAAFVILALVAILAFRDLMVQTILYGLVPHLVALEAELRRRLSLDESDVLLVNHSIRAWRNSHGRAVAAFGWVFFLAITAIPAWSLYEIHHRYDAAVYVAVSVVIFAAYRWLGTSLINGVLTQGVVRPSVPSRVDASTAAVPVAGEPSTAIAESRADRSNEQE